MVWGLRWRWACQSRLPILRNWLALMPCFCMQNAPVALCSRALCSVSQDDVVLLSAYLDEEPWRLEALDEDEPLLWHAVERESANAARLVQSNEGQGSTRGVRTGARRS